MTSSSGAPRYSSTRLLTYSKSPSGAALHSSAGIASTSKRSSCSLLDSAFSALPSFDIDRSTADPQTQTFIFRRRRVAEGRSPRKGARCTVILPPNAGDGRRPFGLRSIDRPAQRRGGSLADLSSVSSRRMDDRGQSRLSPSAGVGRATRRMEFTTKGPFKDLGQTRLIRKPHDQGYCAQRGFARYHQLA